LPWFSIAGPHDRKKSFGSLVDLLSGIKLGKISQQSREIYESLLCEEPPYLGIIYN
jgi:hypothetical protein